MGLESEAAVAAAPMAEMSRKQTHFASANVMRSRRVEGKARRHDHPSITD